MIIILTAILQTGHLKVIDGQKKRDAEDQVKTEKNQLKRPPSWLIDDVAKKEWRRVVKRVKQAKYSRKSGLKQYRRLLQCVRKLRKSNRNIESADVLC